MFGYIRMNKGELRMRDYETYRAVYCSLCRELGRSFGPFARLALPYDLTFLAALMLALEPDCPGFSARRCPFNLLVRCRACRGRPQGLRYSAAVTVCMLYYKLRDDLADDGFWRRLPRLLLYPRVALARRKAARLFPVADAVLADMMTRQQTVEGEQGATPDAAAEPSAAALGRLFADGVTSPDDPDDPRRRVLLRLGYCLGRWVYLVDALDDLSDDLRRGRYNPYAAREGLGRDAGAGEIARVRRQALPGLTASISEAAAALHLLELYRFEDLLENVVTLGLDQVQQAVADGTFRARRSRRDRKDMPV